MSRMNHRPDILTAAPNQFAVGERCDECDRPLSRYNPYTVCGPCRVRMFNARNLALRVAAVAGGERHEEEPTLTEYHGFPRRQPVRRGPLLAESHDSLGDRVPSDLVG